MDGVKQQIHARQMEAQETKHQFELRKEQRKLRAELDQTRNKNKDTIVTVRKDYERTVVDEQNKLQAQLTKIRNKNKELLKNEELRYQKMVEETKTNHKQKIVELEISQDKEVEKQQTDHENFLDTARQKFEAEKMKFEA
tara:strand:+ start:109 stop:528 length:420 start_codon:yes stop_codon:yes gene_type:complete